MISFRSFADELGHLLKQADVQATFAKVAEEVQQGSDTPPVEESAEESR